jgi:hypothetical protein
MFRSILLLNSPQEINLKQCAACDRIPVQLQRDFHVSLKRRGIRYENAIVRSMRFNPEAVESSMIWSQEKAQIWPIEMLFAELPIT